MSHSFGPLVLSEHVRSGRRCLVQQFEPLLRQPGQGKLRLSDDAARDRARAGLKHPQEVKGSFGSEPLDHDSLEYTVMSYRSYIGASTTSGYTNARPAIRRR